MKPREFFSDPKRGYSVRVGDYRRHGHLRTRVAVRTEDVSPTEGVVEAIVGMTGSFDNSFGESIAAGAIDESLKSRNPKGCVGHDWRKDVARTIEAEELESGDERIPQEARDAGARGIYILGQYNLDSDDIEARQAWSRIKFFGADQEWSIGFFINEFVVNNEEGAVTFSVVDWVEWSNVLAGADPNTETISQSDDSDLAVTAAWQRYCELFGTDIAVNIDAFCDHVEAARAANALGLLGSALSLSPTEPVVADVSRARLVEIWKRRADAAAKAAV